MSVAVSIDPEIEVPTRLAWTKVPKQVPVWQEIQKRQCGPWSNSQR